MRKVAGIGIVITVITLGLASPGAADPFGLASGYNVFVLGNMTLTNTDVGGRVAVGGNGQFTNFAIDSGNNGSNGAALAADASRADLVVAGNATLTNGSIQKGSALVSGAVQQTGVGYPTAGAGLKSGASVVDFATAATDLRQEAEWLSSFTATGSVTKAWSTLTLQGNDAALNVFTLSVADLLNISSLQIQVPALSTVLVNVQGSAISLMNMGYSINGSQSSAQAQNVLWNFAQAQTLTLGGLQWGGSILAPWAAMQFANGQINGQVAVASLSSTGEFHNVAFGGALPDPASTPNPTPVPEPSTLLLVLGGGAVGGVRRWLKKGLPTETTPL